jgi:uncharacterized protein YdaU (DUF1376 family)
MALRDQPYLPLYIQDFLTDEKLIECSAKATGVYVRLMCIMHKSEDYGKILLKQKDKQNDKQIENFAIKLGKQMPYSQQEIHDALQELLAEKVLSVEGDSLVQKRMVKDNALSLVRSEAGKKGANVKDFAKAKPEAKGQANTEYEIETEIEGDNEFKYELSKAEKKVKTIEAKIDIVYPFVTDRFINAWSLWLDHRKAIKKPYRSGLSQQTALKKLSEYDEDTAIKMINQSIENDWQGLFELKDQKNGKSGNNKKQQQSDNSSEYLKNYYAEKIGGSKTN